MSDYTAVSAEIDRLRSEVERLIREQERLFARVQAAEREAVHWASAHDNARAWSRRWKTTARSHKSAHRLMRKGYAWLRLTCIQATDLDQVKAYLGVRVAEKVSP